MPTLTLDDLSNAVSDTLLPKFTDSFSNLLAEHDQKTTNQKTGQQNGSSGEHWWEKIGLGNEAPKVPTIINFKEDGSHEILEGDAAREMWSTATFNAAITQPIEKPLNDIYPQVPFGSILLGGGLGIIVNDIVDAFVPETDATTGAMNIMNPAIKVGVGIGVPLVLGTKLFSRTGNLFFAGSLILIAAQQFDVVQNAITSLVNWLKGLFGGTTTTANRLTQQQQQARLLARQRARQLAAGNTAGRVVQGQSPGIDAMHDLLRAVL